MTDLLKPSPAEIGIRNRTFAEQKRAVARSFAELGEPLAAQHADRDAASLEARAAEMLNPINHATGPMLPGNGGEMVAPTAHNRADCPGFINLVRERPDMLAADASVLRMGLADNAGALVLAVEVADTIQAQNSVEKMLAHQMAATHTMAMRLLAKAHQFSISCLPTSPHGNSEVASIEAARLSNAAARLMETYQRSMLTLDRIRNGGRQTVVVQHVVVGEGGQAVVAGTIEPTSSKPRGGARTK